MNVEQSHKKVAALAYAAMGWHIFPVWNVKNGVCACGDANCKADGTGKSKPGKHPIGKIATAGQLSATNSPRMIETWWDQYPEANIGINLNKSELVVIDVDPRNGGNVTLEALEGKYGTISAEVHAFSGGNGQHFYYHRPPSIGTLPGKLGPGVDLITNGYVIAAPSTHMSGTAYEWEGNSDPLDGASPGPLPDWLRELSVERAVGVSHGSIRAVDEDQIEDLRDAIHHLDYDDRDTWIRAGMCLRELGDPGFEIWDAWSANSSKYKEKEIRTKWNVDIRPGCGLHMESLFSMAQKEGWINSPRASSSSEPSRKSKGSAEDWDFSDIDMSDIPDAVGVIVQEGGVEDCGGLAVINCDRVNPKQINWLWDGYIAIGKLQFIAGSPGCGKSLITLDIASTISRGRAFPDGKKPNTKHGSTLIFSSEDDLEDTIVPRLIGAGADMSKIRVIQGTLDKKGNVQPFDPKRDLKKIVDAFRANPFDLLIVDSLVDAVKGDTNKQEDVRQSLTAITKMAAHCGFAVLGILHFNKGSQGRNVNERVMGSQAFTAIARLAMFAQKGKEGEPNVLMVGKTNITKSDKGFEYTLDMTSFQHQQDVFDVVKIRWGCAVTEDSTSAINRAEGAIPEMEYREMKADALVDKFGRSGGPAAWLKDVLSSCEPIAVKDIEEMGNDAGFTISKLRRAAHKLGVKIDRGMNGWFWTLSAEQASKSTAHSLAFLDD